MRRTIDLSTVEFASYPQRLAARVIDIMLVALFFALAISLAGFEVEPGTTPTSDIGLGGWAWLLPIVYIGYEIPTTASRGQTIGKRIMNICIVRTDGEIGIGLDRALTRFIVLMALWVLPVVGLLGLGWYFFDPKRQNIPDKAARTFVVRVPEVATDNVDQDGYQSFED